MRSRWLCVGALAFAACSEPRQIVLSIRTTAGVPCEIDTIRIVTKAAGTTTFEQRLSDGRLPVNITLLDDTATGAFDLEISGLMGNVEVMRINGPLEFRDREAVETVLLEPKCSPEVPCELAAAMTAGAEVSETSGATCANVKRYDTSKAIEGFESACTVPGSGNMLTEAGGRLVELTAVDSKLKARLDASGFQFYGQPVRHIWIAKDGYISFTKGTPEPDKQILPGSLDREIKGDEPPPPRSVMAFWDTLSLKSDGVCYSLDGAAGQQKLRVTWAHVCLTSMCTSDNLNFTITLDEIDDHIALTYGDMIAANQDGARGINATVGLVNDAIGCAAEQCVFETGLCMDESTPCGYSQVFSRTKQDAMLGFPSNQFTPVVEPD
jgi:hypothetical protein